LKIILDNALAPALRCQDDDWSGLGNALVADTRTTDELVPLSVSETPEAKFREFLEIRGEKLTEPRRVLVRQIFDTHKHFDADELVRDVHDAGHAISRATVYRTLRLLVEAGLLRELRLTNRTAYEHDYGYPAHDHMHCTVCNRVVEFRNDEIRKIRDAVSRAHGFRPSGHRFLITGVCSACSRVHSPRRRLDLI
jgi:Fur family ferric uptake transcriptional regulator